MNSLVGIVAQRLGRHLQHNEVVGLKDEMIDRLQSLLTAVVESPFIQTVEDSNACIDPRALLLLDTESIESHLPQIPQPLTTKRSSTLHQHTVQSTVSALVEGAGSRRAQQVLCQLLLQHLQQPLPVNDAATVPESAAQLIVNDWKAQQVNQLLFVLHVYFFAKSVRAETAASQQGNFVVSQPNHQRSASRQGGTLNPLYAESFRFRTVLMHGFRSAGISLERSSERRILAVAGVMSSICDAFGEPLMLFLATFLTNVDATGSPLKAQ